MSSCLHDGDWSWLMGKVFGLFGHQWLICKLACCCKICGLAVSTKRILFVSNHRWFLFSADKFVGLRLLNLWNYLSVSTPDIKSGLDAPFFEFMARGFEFVKGFFIFRWKFFSPLLRVINGTSKKKFHANHESLLSFWMFEDFKVIFLYLWFSSMPVICHCW